MDCSHDYWCLTLHVWYLRVAKEVEKIVKNNGAIPATVAIMSGKIHVGM